MRLVRVSLLGLLLSSSICGAARADEDSPLGETPREVDVGSGFQLGVRVGVGQLTVGFQGRAIWGRVAPLEISAGVTLARNLVAFGVLYGAHLVNPVSDYAHTDALDLYGFGPGARYRLEPSGVVLSWALLATRLHASGPGQFGPAIATDWGLTARFSVGADWLVSPHWRLGFAGEVLFGRMQAQRFPPETQDYTAKGAMLLLAASYERPSSASLGGAPSAALPGTDVHSHDGFFLSASFGPAWLKLKSPALFGQVSGRGTAVALSAGHGLGHNLTVFGELYEAVVVDPAFVSDHLADLEMHGFGPGLRWYGTPLQAFASATALVCRFSLHNDIPGDGRYGIRDQSDWRVLARVAIGKEWWVSKSWGLGLAAAVFYGRLPAGSDLAPRAPYTIEGVTLSLSATFG